MLKQVQHDDVAVLHDKPGVQLEVVLLILILSYYTPTLIWTVPPNGIESEFRTAIRLI